MHQSKVLVPAKGIVAFAALAAVYLLALPADAATLTPGTEVALYSRVHKRFVRMNAEGRADSGAVTDILSSLPAGWTWERFVVVNGGNNTIALYNAANRRFLRVSDAGAADSGDPHDANLPTGWAWERFSVVELGNGEVALYGASVHRFLRMNDKAGCDSSQSPTSVLPANWSWERFYVVAPSSGAGPSAGANTPASRPAGESCREKVKDLARCGQSCVDETKNCVDSTVKCGTEAYKCGTEKVTDAARCGEDTWNDVKHCLECAKHPFDKCHCKKPKTCEIDKYCNRDKMCKGPPKCDIVHTCGAQECNVVRAACAAFPDDYKAQILANATLNLKDRILAVQARARDEAAKRANFGSSADASRLLGGLSEAARNTAALRQKWEAQFRNLLADSAKKDVLKRVLIRVSKKQIDATLKADVKQLDTWLIGDGKTRWSGAPSRWNLLPEGTAYAATYEDQLGFSVAVGIDGGLGLGGDFAIGVAWDRNGAVKGLISGGVLAGLVMDIGGDLIYRVHPTNIDGIGGGDMGISGNATYGVGANACVEWSIPFNQPVPTWGYGVSVGAPGGAIAWSFSTTELFP